jgi:hypothetical protein
MTIPNTYVEEMMQAVRVSSTTAKAEVTDLINAAIADLHIKGVIVTDIDEALSKAAIKLYVKANYGYDKDSDRFLQAYNALRDSMALSGEYSGEVGG